MCTSQNAICDLLAHRIAATVVPNPIPALFSLLSMDRMCQLDRKQSGASFFNPAPHV